MKKIRIGNDIRLAVDLREQLARGQQESEQPVDSINVRQVSAYLINTTKLAEYKNKVESRSRFIGRFPREPFSHDYNSTAWCLFNSGRPTWHAYPTNAGSIYSGFGTEPYKGLKEIDALSKSIQYRTTCYPTQYQNTILVDFPAEAQLYAGKYTLIIVAKLYAPGYNNSIKTVSVDIPNVFELVKNTDDTIEQQEPGETIETGVIIDTGNNNSSSEYTEPETPTIPDVVYDDIYVNEGSISNGILSLGRTDDSTVDIDLSGIVGWYEGD